MLNIKDLLSHNLNIFPEYITVGNIFSILTFKYEEVIHITLFNWINIGNLNINFGILLDPLSLVVMVPIGIVTSAVLFYSIDYMRYDPARNRFYVVISIFALFMTLLIVSDNYLIMFIGWELIGVISYLLISFWNTSISAMKSALSAILINRMGDALFVIFIGTIISLYNSVDFNTIELLTPHTNTTILNLLAIMLLIAATAKSAQLGLHSWLLFAMASTDKHQYKDKSKWIMYLLENPLVYLTGYESSEKDIPLTDVNVVSTNEESIPYNIWVYDINTNLLP